ncbi:Outer membrane protein beta-barrel domain-containing protein [Algoriphagus locisalis]|uniref:Outer membrane protein beta-barrel domain-containing protein n=1 Tax=Algoriphagus locisalis TaxID=305507 RepID=A0A1I6ZT02_9BACT|nr:outer membrane beta-barrel protein [Algoriphagus locisalis]SFT65826.1 Outer membrane protein beta-barrel domain-containing protein [Algoriphagus locisalis]
MKNALLLSIILLISLSVTAQSGLEVKGYFGVSGAQINWNKDLDGASSADIESLLEVGVLLSKSISEKFSLTGGVNYGFAQVSYYPNIPPCVNCLSIAYNHNPDFKMLSIPVYAEYKIGRIFYAAAGPVLDFQLSEGNNMSDQSGVGYLVGLGTKLNTNKLSFSIFSNYKRHSVIPFENEGNYKQILQELGVQLGVGYQF